VEIASQVQAECSQRQQQWSSWQRTGDTIQLQHLWRAMLSLSLLLPTKELALSRRIHRLEALVDALVTVPVAALLRWVLENLTLLEATQLAPGCLAKETGCAQPRIGSRTSSSCP